MSLSKKSVSLFEVLPPSQAKTAPAATAAVPEEPQRTSETAPALAKTRQSVSIDSGATSTESEASTFRPKKETTPNRKLSSHQVAGVSVREKSDPFFLIVLCMLALVIISNLVTYRYSYQKGIRAGAAISLSQRSQSDLPTRPAKLNTPKSEVSNNSKTHTASLKTTLPTTFKQLTPEQSRATVPPEEIKKYTLQIQTFGRKSITLAKELVASLEKSGFDSFYDKNDGAVFVGRLKSYRSSEASQLRNEILRFNWRNRDFKDSYFRSIPKNLLEP